MPTIPFVVRPVDVDFSCAMSGHAEIAAGAASLVAVPGVLSRAVASSSSSSSSSAVASLAASAPMAGVNTSIDTVSPANVPCGVSPNGESPSVVPLIEPALGQPEVPADAVKTHFTVFHLNVQGLSDANLALFDTLLQEIGRPTYVAVTETFLDRTVESICISGYHLISRLDRREGIRLDRGGVALFARDGFELSIVHIGNSEKDERSWHIIHADSGPMLLGVWYRRPQYNEIAPIQRLDHELLRYSSDCIATILVGDMNVHNPEWLRWSSRPTPEGSELEAICCVHGLKQHVREPTRINHLLDLVLSSFSSGVTCSVTPGIHELDHKGVLTEVKLSVPASEPVSRRVYDYKHADWSGLCEQLSSTDWGCFFEHLYADEAAERFTAKLLEAVENNIPVKWIRDKVYAHPWLNDECRRALSEKHEATGTASFIEKRDACTETFRVAHRSYVVKTRDELREMSSSSRGWWKLSGSLLTKARGSVNIPPLKVDGDQWATTAQAKADELAKTFRAKSLLPENEVNEYTTLEPGTSDCMNGFLRLRVRDVRKLLKALDEFSGTGPDLLPARVLKRCADVISLPVTLLTRKLLHEGRWPECWRKHWVHSIYKKGSKAEAKNYRGVHLTPQLPKIVERAIGTLLLPWLEKQQAFGPHQYAYGKGRGYKDVLVINVCSWLLAMEQGDLVGLYCSDVSGAFDRVSRPRLVSKLELLGLHPSLSAFLASWLEDRVSEVVVGGQCSLQETLCDSVFQGTVLGPPLWNCFYKDARRAANALDFTETVFADDFNCFKRFKRSKISQALRAEIEMKGAQKELHLWGKANQIIFDPCKESFHFLHRRLHSGTEFKLLGVVFDSKLLMHSAARNVATEAGWRLQQLLKSRCFFTTPELMHLYKAQVLSYVESSTPAIFHASPSVLEPVDRVQRRLLRELGMSEVEALLNFRLAPLPSRRDMAMLGALHKVTLGLAPPQLAAFFPRAAGRTTSFDRQRLRHWRLLHDKQLHSECAIDSTDIMRRSLFGLVHLYNRLPQRTVGQLSIKSFQRSLQEALKVYASAPTAPDDWQRLYSVGWRRLSLAQFDGLFN